MGKIQTEQFKQLQRDVHALDRQQKHSHELLKQAARHYSGLKARTLFSVATAVGIGGGFCVNKMLALDNMVRYGKEFTNIETLAYTTVGGMIFAVLAGAWLTFYNSTE